MSTVQRVACDYLDGVTSARRSVTLRVEDAHAIVEGEGVLRREPLGRVRVSERMGSAPRLVDDEQRHDLQRLMDQVTPGAAARL